MGDIENSPLRPWARVVSAGRTPGLLPRSLAADRDRFPTGPLNKSLFCWSRMFLFFFFFLRVKDIPPFFRVFEGYCYRVVDN